MDQITILSGPPNPSVALKVTKVKSTPHDGKNTCIHTCTGTCNTCIICVQVWEKLQNVYQALLVDCLCDDIVIGMGQLRANWDTL